MRLEQARLQSALHEARYWAERALRHIGTMTVLTFTADQKTIDAVARCLSVTGEAAVRARDAGEWVDSPTLWSLLLEAKDARNEAMHEYEKIEADNLYATVNEILRPLAEEVRI